jgi:hypothetical protein
MANCIERSPSSEANGFSVRQEIPLSLWYPSTVMPSVSTDSGPKKS